MKITELKKHLNKESNEDLVKHIVELFKKNEFVKDYYNLKYDNEHGSALLSKHKELIRNEFFPNRGFGKARLSVAKKSISEFKKLSSDNVHVADIMLYYVEMGVEFTNSYGDIDEDFYMSMEGMFEQVVKFVVKEDIVSQFIDRCYDVVSDTNGIGWGFHDQLRAIYEDYFNEGYA